MMNAALWDWARRIEGVTSSLVSLSHRPGPSCELNIVTVRAAMLRREIAMGTDCEDSRAPCLVSAIRARYPSAFNRRSRADVSPRYPIKSVLPVAGLVLRAGASLFVRFSRSIGEWLFQSLLIF